MSFDGLFTSNPRNLVASSGLKGVTLTPDSEKVLKVTLGTVCASSEKYLPNSNAATHASVALPIRKRTARLGRAGQSKCIFEHPILRSKFS